MLKKGREEKEGERIKKKDMIVKRVWYDEQRKGRRKWCEIMTDNKKEDGEREKKIIEKKRTYMRDQYARIANDREDKGNKKRIRWKGDRR